MTQIDFTLQNHRLRGETAVGYMVSMRYTFVVEAARGAGVVVILKTLLCWCCVCCSVSWGVLIWRIAHVLRVRGIKSCRC